MIDAIEAVLLLILPWSFAAKSLALGVMWWELQFQTVPIGPLGQRINVEFRDQFIMSLFITAAMVILSRSVQADEVDWPFVSLVLMGLALFPFRAAWSHFQTYRTYRRIATGKEAGR